MRESTKITAISHPNIAFIK